MERFMGVDADGLAAIGRLVVAAGRVEMVLALVANELGVTKPLSAASDVMKDVRRAARQASGSLALLSERVLSWLDELRQPLGVRHRAVHGVRMTSISPEREPIPVQWLMRKNEESPVDVDEFTTAAELLAMLHTQGMELFGALHIANLEHLKRGGAGS